MLTFSRHCRVQDREYYHRLRNASTARPGRYPTVSIPPAPLTQSPFASVFSLEMILIGFWFGDHGNALRFYGKRLLNKADISTLDRRVQPLLPRVGLCR